MLRFKFSCFFALGLALASTPLSAQLYELPFTDIIQRAGIVAEGRVVAQQCLWDRSGSHIYTLNTVEFSAIYKGSALAQPVLQVVTCGGRVGDRMELDAAVNVAAKIATVCLTLLVLFGGYGLASVLHVQAIGGVVGLAAAVLIARRYSIAASMPDWPIGREVW